MIDAIHAHLLTEVSTDHYLDGKSKVEIAKERGFSRFQVARMLAEARELGIVRIEIAPPAHLDLSLAQDLATALGVHEVLVVQTGTDSSATREHLAREIARVAVQRITQDSTLGISWSRTIEAAAHHIDTLPPCDVVQLVGALPVAGSGNSLELIQHFKSMAGVRTWPVWAPLVVDDAATAAGLSRQPEIAQALHRADSLDVAVVAVGAWSPQSSTVFDHVSAKERAAATAAGAVAECSGRLFDAQGRPVRTALDERIIGVTLDQLARTPEVITVGYGADVAIGLLGAARGGFASTLVIDEAAAEQLGAIVASEQHRVSGE
ncbi:transcriptional regulator [Sanguibacter gelidistatuariae]|uniref:Transcriptional regulator n=1 Tax=Sanguibacter gelidistatuariae TaxID=1814289 RepID=A0A1G6HKJ5_9MICO|nr:sugar-binding domain-containing protein [Sanguibacter gelidistatuariae]SDB94721.1 transcriptional regulator [Sanguibacter gelidistatuariae]